MCACARSVCVCAEHQLILSTQHSTCYPFRSPDFLFLISFWTPRRRPFCRPSRFCSLSLFLCFAVSVSYLQKFIEIVCQIPFTCFSHFAKNFLFASTKWWQGQPDFRRCPLAPFSSLSFLYPHPLRFFLNCICVRVCVRLAVNLRSRSCYRVAWWHINYKLVLAPRAPIQPLYFL